MYYERRLSAHFCSRQTGGQPMTAYKYGTRTPAARKRNGVVGVLKAVIASWIAVAAIASAQQALDPVEFDIPQQSVGSALLSFSEQANLQIVVDASVVDGLQSVGISLAFELHQRVGV
ncbi:MAG: hypothetical protein ACE5F8_07775, partial [Woeseiaceae bacterium]